LAVVERSHLGCLAYPPFTLVKRRNRRRLAAHPFVKQQIVKASIAGTSGSGMLRLLFRFEGWLGRRI
jgi:hypothetical protein